MGVAGYDKVKTRVIEGKKKCIYKKPKGNKEYVKGFGKMRSVESYIKLCKKKAASKVSKSKPKPKSKPKSTKSKKMRSRSARRYGGFLEFFTEGPEAGPDSSDGPQGTKQPKSGPAPPAKFTNMAPPPSLQAFTDKPPHQLTGGSSCGRGGSKSSSYDDKELQHQGGKRKKRRTSKSPMLKMMMAAFRKKSKGKRRRGGEQKDD
jgi:hypothetical protein